MIRITNKNVLVFTIHKTSISLSFEFFIPKLSSLRDAVQISSVRLGLDQTLTATEG